MMSQKTRKRDLPTSAVGFVGERVVLFTDRAISQVIASNALLRPIGAVSPKLNATRYSAPLMNVIRLNGGRQTLAPLSPRSELL